MKERLQKIWMDVRARWQKFQEDARVRWPAMHERWQAFCRARRGALVGGAVGLSALAVALVFLLVLPAPIPAAVVATTEAPPEPTATALPPTPTPTALPPSPTPTALPPTQTATKTAIPEPTATPTPELRCTDPEIADAIHDFFESYTVTYNIDGKVFVEMPEGTMEKNGLHYEAFYDEGWGGYGISTGITNTMKVVMDGDIYKLYTLDIITWGQEMTTTLMTVPLVYEVEFPGGQTYSLIFRATRGTDAYKMFMRPNQGIDYANGGSITRPQGMDWNACSDFPAFEAIDRQVARKLCDLGKIVSPQNGELPNMVKGIQPPEDWVLMGFIPVVKHDNRDEPLEEYLTLPIPACRP